MEGARIIGRDKVCCWVVCALQLFRLCAARQVLERFRSLFIDTVDANAIVHDLKHEGIINDGDLTTITRIPGSTEQNKNLHERLLKTCDKRTLRRVCDMMINVKGNAKMRRLGEEMKNMLEGKCCVLVRTSCYTFSMVYGVYCMRSQGRYAAAGSRAVKYAICCHTYLACSVLYN